MRNSLTLLALSLLALSGAPAWAKGEFKSRAAKSAQRKLEQSLKKARKDCQGELAGGLNTYERDMKRALKTVMRRNDLEEARRVQEGIEWAEKAKSLVAREIPGRGELSDDRAYRSPEAIAAQKECNDLLGRTAKAHEKEVLDSYETYAEAMRRAFALAMKQGDLPEAERIKDAQGEAKARIDSIRAKSSWVVLFRSTHPEDWNTLKKEEDRFARPIASAPKTVTYLRLTRLDTKAYVVLQLTREELGKEEPSGRHSWNGAGTVNGGGVHLGIDDAKLKLTFRDGGRIMVGNSRSTAGWGFGHKVHKNDVQYASWAGEEIPLTGFEIAVTSKELSEEERKHLLK